jgi:hypothetical protein
MSNFDLKKYLVEGKLYEEVDSNEAEVEAQKLMDALGVMVKSSSEKWNNTIRLKVYPDKKPDGEFYNSRTAQNFSLVVDNGKYLFSHGFGYGRSIQPIAKFFGKEARDSSIAGMNAVDTSLRPVEVSLNTIKNLVKIMQSGLAGEAGAQYDFYKDWSNPD